MKTIIELLMKILEILQSKQTKSKVKTEFGTLGEHFKNIDHLDSEAARALKIKYSELVFQDLYNIEVKAHLFKQINDIYENSDLKRPQIASGLKILRQSENQLQHSLGTFEWFVGKMVFSIGYGFIWAGIFLVPLIYFWENEPSALSALTWVIKCWLVGFPLIFMSLPFYNASLIGKYLVRRAGETDKDRDYYRILLRNCRINFAGCLSSFKKYFNSKPSSRPNMSTGSHECESVTERDNS